MAEETDAPDGEVEVIDAPEEQAQEKPRLSEIEELASEMGWKPKDAWKGDDSAWRPARDYVKATKDANRTLHADMKDMKRQIEGISRASSRMTERAVTEARAQWEAAHDQAVEDGDKAGAKKAAAKLAELDREEAPVPAPEAEAFARQHSSWFNVDREATAYAIKRADHYASEGLSPARQLVMVEKDVRRNFSELFEDDTPKPKPKQPSVGAPGTRSVQPTAREKGYATLPPDARKACDAWVKANEGRGDWASKDTWAKNFYEDQEAANG